MPNMSLKKNEMPSQDPNVRNKNFLEVALGYTEEQALDEAARCLNCKNHPCVSGCPVQVKIPEFIKKITEKDSEGAYQVIHETSFSNWLDTQLDSPVYMVLTILIVAGLLAGGIASTISVRREGKKIEELKRRRMIEE